jgi:hypothetical protein
VDCLTSDGERVPTTDQQIHHQMLHEYH